MGESNKFICSSSPCAVAEIVLSLGVCEVSCCNEAGGDSGKEAGDKRFERFVLEGRLEAQDSIMGSIRCDKGVS